MLAPFFMAHGVYNHVRSELETVNTVWQPLHHAVVEGKRVFSNTQTRLNLCLNNSGVNARRSVKNAASRARYCVTASWRRSRVLRKPRWRARFRRIISGGEEFEVSTNCRLYSCASITRSGSVVALWKLFVDGRRLLVCHASDMEVRRCENASYNVPSWGR